MTLPDNIRIIDRTYTIKTVLHPMAENGSAIQTGLHDDGTGEITLMTENRGEKQCISAIWQTLWHEILHAINDRMKCDLDENNIDRLATGINCVMQDNFNIPGQVE